MYFIVRSPRIHRKRPNGSLQPFPVAATQKQLGAIAQAYCVVAVKERRELSHPIQIDDGGTMNAQEFPRVQSLLNRGHRASQQMRFAPDMQAHVVVGSFNPIYVFHPQEEDPTSRTDDQTLRFTALFLEIFEQRHQTFVESMLSPLGNFRFGAMDGLAKALPVERFQQVVEGMDL